MYSVQLLLQWNLEIDKIPINSLWGRFLLKLSLHFVFLYWSCVYLCVFIDGLLWDSGDRPLYAVRDLHASYKWRRRVEDKWRFQKVKRFKFAVPDCNSGAFTYLLKLRLLSINKLNLYFCYEQYLIIRNVLHEKNQMKWCSCLLA